MGGLAKLILSPLAPPFTDMQILLNGEPHSIDHALTITELIESLALTGKRLAIELNGEILPRSCFATTRLKANDRLEIVHAIGGG